jgi:choline dehydrogenase-like flavoprotein
VTYDYIITGGGAAGCVLANRLSADPSIRVLLLEAGGSDWHPLFHMPAGFAKMTKGIASWGWSTVPQKHMKNRVLAYTQAKVIGGGTTINAQIYTRGAAADFDEWEREEGATGWSYAAVLPYFKRAENNQRWANEFHSYGGPPSSRPGRNSASRSTPTSTVHGKTAWVTTNSRSSTPAARRQPPPI